MAADPVRLDQELALLADLHRGSDPLLASLSAAIFLEDASDIVFSDPEIEAGVAASGVVDRVRTDDREGP